MTRLSVGLSALIGLIITLPGIGFVLAPVFRKPKQQWRTVGKLEDFKEGGFVLVQYEDPSPVVWSGVTAKAGAWIRRISDSEFIAF